jgi:ParB family chromosome partitioning protein
VNIVIDKGFKNLLMPLSPIEFGFLEASIIEEGCREKLIVWSQGNILVDGHNRYEACTANGIDFEVEVRDFESREAVEDWIDKNQAARRNLHPDDFKIVTGRIYNRRKKVQGSNNQHVQCRGEKDQVDPFHSTADEVAAELGISAPTVKRNGQRAEVYDKVASIDSEAAEAAKVVPQEVISQARKQPAEVAAETVKAAAKPHVSNNSGEQDWYTPEVYLEAARKVVGPFDLDPASSDTAQKFVKAKTYFTKDDDGLIQDWRGVVWLNPPYGSGIVDKFAEKLVDSLGSIKSAVVLVNNATETRWFQLLANNSNAICFPSGRIKFLDSTGEPKNSPLQGQAFLYFGQKSEKFRRVFGQFGFVVESEVRVGELA